MSEQIEKLKEAIARLEADPSARVGDAEMTHLLRRDFYSYKQEADTRPEPIKPIDMLSSATLAYAQKANKFVQDIRRALNFGHIAKEGYPTAKQKARHELFMNKQSELAHEYECLWELEVDGVPPKWMDERQYFVSLHNYEGISRLEDVYCAIEHEPLHVVMTSDEHSANAAFTINHIQLAHLREQLDRLTGAHEDAEVNRQRLRAWMAQIDKRSML